MYIFEYCFAFHVKGAFDFVFSLSNKMKLVEWEKSIARWANNLKQKKKWLEVLHSNPQSVSHRTYACMNIYIYFHLQYLLVSFNATVMERSKMVCSVSENGKKKNGNQPQPNPGWYINVLATEATLPFVHLCVCMKRQFLCVVQLCGTNLNSKHAEQRISSVKPTTSDLVCPTERYTYILYYLTLRTLAISCFFLLCLSLSAIFHHLRGVFVENNTISM